MIALAEVVETFLHELQSRYAQQLLPGQRCALSAILRCRTEECGSTAVDFAGNRYCQPHCFEALGYFCSSA